MGMEIVLVEIKGGDNRPIVRAYIDKPCGVTLEDCEHFSKRFSVLLDVEDWIPVGLHLGSFITRFQSSSRQGIGFPEVCWQKCPGAYPLSH